MQLPIVECGAKNAPFIRSIKIASDKTYYRKQMQLPIVECGAKNAPFIGSEKIASDKTYYTQKHAKNQSYFFTIDFLRVLGH